jgi:GNAT superfamily N-acetyltransferase
MPTIDLTVSCPVHDSFRVQQVAGMFDVPLSDKSTERFQVELPDVTEEWQIGLIVGPSGSGKSTIARQAFANDETRMTNDETLPSSFVTRHSSFDWPADRAVVDCFGDISVRRVVDLFTAVGFGSPPSWVKPYHVLSNGERFRCDLARALSKGLGARDGKLQPPVPSPQSPLVLFDEFTSVVDRNVAKFCSAAIAKAIRRGHILCRFVAVTCHYDVAEWLEPDWVLDMATSQLERLSPGATRLSSSKSAGGRFRRPAIELEIHRCSVAAWQLFKRHHYLSGSLANGARCYLATWAGIPVNFCATLPVLSKRHHRRFTRIVTLPDYQGIGIGMRAVAAVAELHRAEGLRISVTSSHPALIRHCRRSSLWRATHVRTAGASRRTGAPFQGYRSAAGRAVVSFEYVGKQGAESTEHGGVSHHPIN